MNERNADSQLDALLDAQDAFRAARQALVEACKHLELMLEIDHIAPTEPVIAQIRHFIDREAAGILATLR